MIHGRKIFAATFLVLGAAVVSSCGQNPYHYEGVLEAEQPPTKVSPSPSPSPSASPQLRGEPAVGVYLFEGDGE